jgi:CRP/FNR family transcriptional regulator, cyclic AMP receptor protein
VDVPAGRRVDAWDEGMVLLVRRGAVVVSSVAEPGRGSAIDMLGPGHAFGIEALARTGPCRVGRPGSVPPIRHHARALVDARVSLIPGTRAERVSTEGLEAAGALLELMAAVSERMERRLVRTLTLPVPARLHEELSDLANTFGRQVPGGRSIELPLTQDLLAELTGSVRESVNRAVRALVACGLLERRGRRYVVRERP